MKAIILFLIAFNSLCLAQDTLGTHYLVSDEILCCFGTKNQLKCIDSLIQINSKSVHFSGKTNAKKVRVNQLRKLTYYHLNAGYICGMRGNLIESFAYFNKMEMYLDSLNQVGKGNDFGELKGMSHYQKAKFCSIAYKKDTLAFNSCNCMQYFKVTNEDIKTVDSNFRNDKKDNLPSLKNPYWGKLYRNDTLRIKNEFISDKNSIRYYEELLESILLNRLQQNPAYFEMLGDPSLKITRDTLIYKLSSVYKNESLQRSCELVFTSSKKINSFEYFTMLIGNIEFPVISPNTLKNLNLYIPIVITTGESESNHVFIHDDHIKIEIKKIKAIDPK